MKKVYRNYCSDKPAMYRDIYIAICECFDEHQKDEDGVDISVMISHIMRKGRGSYNPMIVSEILKEFEK